MRAVRFDPGRLVATNDTDATELNIDEYIADTNHESSSFTQQRDCRPGGPGAGLVQLGPPTSASGV